MAGIVFDINSGLAEVLASEASGGCAGGIGGLGFQREPWVPDQLALRPPS